MIGSVNPPVGMAHGAGGSRHVANADVRTTLMAPPVVVASPLSTRRGSPTVCAVIDNVFETLGPLKMFEFTKMGVFGMMRHELPQGFDGCDVLSSSMSI